MRYQRKININVKQTFSQLGRINFFTFKDTIIDTSLFHETWHSVICCRQKRSCHVIGSKLFQSCYHVTTYIWSSLLKYLMCQYIFIFTIVVKRWSRAYCMLRCENLVCILWLELTKGKKIVSMRSFLKMEISCNNFPV